MDLSGSTLDPARHPFVDSPHRTLLSLSFWVLVSMVAEPLTGLVDTAFVSQLGAAPLAALGVGTVVLSSLFWVFNFLQIGTQTEIGGFLGAGNRRRAVELSGLALTLAAGLGVTMIAVGLPLIGRAAAAMGAQGRMLEDTVTYLGIRLFAAPSVLVTLTAFGVLRGLQDMRSPMYIALGINLLNIPLDAILIFGWGPIPALGIAGAAWATVVSQFLGALGSLVAVRSRLGFPSRLQGRDATRILSLGGPLLLRTGLLTAFMLLGSRAATTMGEVPAAAHQAIRAVWIFTAFVLDAYALTAQSLTSYFLGAKRLDQARRVARVSCSWALLTGLLLTLLMVAGEGIVTELLVPEVALELFTAGWLICALSQPLNALSFVTDGIHWGTGDFRYLRNAMFLATAWGACGIYFLDEGDADALTTLWLITAGWIAIRAAFGLARIWPGHNGPLAQTPPRDPSQPT